MWNSFDRFWYSYRFVIPASWFHYFHFSSWNLPTSKLIDSFSRQIECIFTIFRSLILLGSALFQCRGYKSSSSEKGTRQLRNQESFSISKYFLCCGNPKCCFFYWRGRTNKEGFKLWFHILHMWKNGVYWCHIAIERNNSCYSAVGGFIWEYPYL